MQVRAYVRGISMSPTKMRVVANLVRRKSVEEAVGHSRPDAEEGRPPHRQGGESLPRPTPRISRAATSPSSTCTSPRSPSTAARTNRRWMPRSMGRANRINHKSSHLTVVVSDDAR
jgi:large subunit ribosomal protein L22